jgi:hypothetical protein
MKPKTVLTVVFISSIFFLALKKGDEWIRESHKGYTIFYKAEQQPEMPVYFRFIEEGKKTVESFFAEAYKAPFAVYIHSNRGSLDTQWQKDWQMPEFKSECWMVASGTAEKLDMIAPSKWKEQACDHDPSNTEETARLICHELFHVFHGQINPDHDFSDVENLDWLVEGFATYASGQCDEARLKKVKTAIEENKVPASLNEFWKGPLKYGLSGSVMIYIEKQYGKKKVRELLAYTKKTEVLNALGTDEAALLEGWKKMMLK